MKYESGNVKLSSYGNTDKWYNYVYQLHPGTCVVVTSDDEIFITNAKPTGNGTYTCIKHTVGGVSCLVSVPDDKTYYAIANSENDNNTHSARLDQFEFELDAYTGLRVANADISGKITASNGEIAGWKISDDSIFKVVSNSESTGYTKAFMRAASSSGGAAFGVYDTSQDGSTFGSPWFYVTYGGALYAKNATITGVLNASGGSIGSLSIESGDSRLYYYESQDNYTLLGLTGVEVIRTSGWFRAGLLNGKDISISMCAGANGLGLDSSGGKLFGTWSGTSGAALTSDKNLKHSIEPLSANYSILFDSLNPVRFKYNDGTSDRYHTGFIAQDLQQAIVNAGLSEQEVAALCTIFDSDKEESYMGIRYDELIALCVNEIQKLKTRVRQLEDKEK
jgi:hypothetical protein